MSEKFPVLHMAQRIIPGTQLASLAGPRAELEIRMQPSPFYGAYDETNMGSHIMATAMGETELVRLLELYIFELESMRREFLKNGVGGA